MTRIRLPMRLRGTEVARELEVALCGRECLRADSARLVACVPARTALGGGSATGVHLVTDEGTIIKVRRHTASGVHERLGLPFRFQLDRHRQALDVLRRERPAHLSLPRADCACSYEAEFREGQVPCPPRSEQTDELARTYVTRHFLDPEQALAFLGRAWATVAGLHGLGIQHGDPSYARFLVKDDGVSLIDLDELMVVDGSPVAWDLAVFLWKAYVPMLSDLVPPGEMVEHLGTTIGPPMASVIQPLGAVALAMAVGQCVVSQKMTATLRRVEAGSLPRNSLAGACRTGGGEDATRSPRQATEAPVALVKRLGARLQERDIRIAELTEAVATRPWTRWRRRWVGPRVGVLRHHPPRTLVIPPHYHQPLRLRTPPTISVVTPVFNAAPFVERTVRSVLAQEYAGLEYLIQDGGSSDGTLDVLARYRDVIAGIDSRPDNGQAEAINRGLARASGEILGYLNADDLLLPGALHYVATYLTRHPEIDVVYGHRVLIDENDGEIGRWVLPPHDDRVLSWADYVPQETLFWRRRIWQRVGGRLDETFEFAMDWDLLLRFREAGARFARLPRFLGAFRVHPDQKSTSRIDDLGAVEMARLRERVHHGAVSTREITRALRGYHLRQVLLHKLYRLRILPY